MNENSAVAAYGKVKDVPAVPDVLSFGNWNNMYDGLWNYSADISKPVEDGAVSVKWEPKEVKQGQEFVTYYGIRNSAAVENGNSVKLVNSPKTSDSFPKAAAALLAASVVSAAASLMIHRKEKADVK